MITQAQVAKVWIELSDAALEVAKNVVDDKPRDVAVAMIKYYDFQIKAATLLSSYAQQEINKQ